MRATAAIGILAVLMFSPLVFDAPRSPIELSVQTPISLTAAEKHLPATTVVRARYAQAPSTSMGGYPLRRRRRIHFWHSWMHFGSRAGAFSWIVFGPLLAITLGAVALPFYLRARRRREQARQDSDGRPLDYAPTQYLPPGVDQTHDRLSTLSDLHSSGALTDEEFETQRQRILGE